MGALRLPGTGRRKVREVWPSSCIRVHNQGEAWKASSAEAALRSRRRIRKESAMLRNMKKQHLLAVCFNLREKRHSVEGAGKGTRYVVAFEEAQPTVG
jgi:hypothetical protein